MFSSPANVQAVACSRSCRLKIGGRPWAALAFLFFAAMSFGNAWAEAASVAVLPFQVHNDAGKTWGAAKEGLADLLQAELSARSVEVVDRTRLKSLMDERGLRELTSPEAMALRMGGLSGAKFLITGHVIVNEVGAGGVQVWVRLTDTATSESLAAIPIAAASMDEVANKLPAVAAQIPKIISEWKPRPKSVGTGEVLPRQDGLWLCRALQHDLAGRPDTALGIGGVVLSRNTQVAALVSLDGVWQENMGMKAPAPSSTARPVAVGASSSGWVLLPPVVLSAGTGTPGRVSQLMSLQFELERCLRQAGRGPVQVMGDLAECMGESDLMAVQEWEKNTAIAKDLWTIPERALMMTVIEDAGSPTVTLRLAARNLVAPNGLVGISTNVTPAAAGSALQSMAKSLLATPWVNDHAPGRRFNSYAYPLPTTLSFAQSDPLSALADVWCGLQNYPDELTASKWIAMTAVWRALRRPDLAKYTAAKGIEELFKMPDPNVSTRNDVSLLPRDRQDAARRLLQHMRRGYSDYGTTENYSLHALRNMVFPEPFSDSRNARVVYPPAREMSTDQRKVHAIFRPLELSPWSTNLVGQVLARLPEEHKERLLWEAAEARYWGRQSDMARAEDQARRVLPRLERAIAVECAEVGGGFLVFLNEYVMIQLMLCEFEIRRGAVAAAQAIATRTRDVCLSREKTASIWLMRIKTLSHPGYEASLAIQKLARIANGTVPPGARTTTTRRDWPAELLACVEKIKKQGWTKEEYEFIGEFLDVAQDKNELRGADVPPIRQAMTNLLDWADPILASKDAPSRAEMHDVLSILTRFQWLVKARNPEVRQAAAEFNRRLVERSRAGHVTVNLAVLTEFFNVVTEQDWDECERRLMDGGTPQARASLLDVLASRLRLALEREGKTDPRPIMARYLACGGEAKAEAIEVKVFGQGITSPPTFFNWLAMESVRRSGDASGDYAREWAAEHSCQESLEIEDWFNAGVSFFRKRDYANAEICLRAFLIQNQKNSDWMKISPHTAVVVVSAQYYLAACLVGRDRPEEATPLLRTILDNSQWANQRLCNSFLITRNPSGSMLGNSKFDGAMIHFAARSELKRIQEGRK